MTAEKTVPVVTLKLLSSSTPDAALPEFDLPVTIQKLAGEELKFAIRAKALKKTEWAKLRDDRQRALLQSLRPDEGAADASVVDTALNNLEKRGSEVSVREGQKRDAELVLKFAVSWPAQEPLSVDVLTALDNEAGGSLDAILGAYDKAIYQGRLGN